MVVLNISCGCGFKTSSIEEAVQHCIDTGHTLTISGTIQKD